MSDLANTIIIIASVIGALGVIIATLEKLLKRILSPVVERLDGLDKRQCRAFLVDFLNEIEQGEKKDSVQYKFAYEVYDHYTKELLGNSYVKDKWEKVMK